MKENGMPIYIVRWPGLVASLVRAEDEEHLVEVLDQFANPDGCEWSVYDGPLFINFELPAEWSIRDEHAGEPARPDQVVIDDVGPVANESLTNALALSLPSADDAYETGTTVLRKAFPVLHAASEAFLACDEAAEREYILPEDRLREALHGEIARLMKVSWRRAQVGKKTDPISSLAHEMDMPVELVKRHADAVLRKHQGDEEDDDGELPPV